MNVYNINRSSTKKLCADIPRAAYQLSTKASHTVVWPLGNQGHSVYSSTPDHIKVTTTIIDHITVVIEKKKTSGKDFG